MQKRDVRFLIVSSTSSDSSSSSHMPLCLPACSPSPLPEIPECCLSLFPLVPPPAAKHPISPVGRLRYLKTTSATLCYARVRQGSSLQPVVAPDDSLRFRRASPKLAVSVQGGLKSALMKAPPDRIARLPRLFLRRTAAASRLASQPLRSATAAPAAALQSAGREARVRAWRDDSS